MYPEIINEFNIWYKENFKTYFFESGVSPNYKLKAFYSILENEVAKVSFFATFTTDDTKAIGDYFRGKAEAYNVNSLAVNGNASDLNPFALVASGKEAAVGVKDVSNQNHMLVALRSMIELHSFPTDSMFGNLTADEAVISVDAETQSINESANKFPYCYRFDIDKGIFCGPYVFSVYGVDSIEFPKLPGEKDDNYYCRSSSFSSTLRHDGQYGTKRKLTDVRGIRLPGEEATVFLERQRKMHKESLQPAFELCDIAFYGKPKDNKLKALTGLSDKIKSAKPIETPRTHGVDLVSYNHITAFGIMK
jgi:hypothetical protein